MAITVTDFTSMCPDILNLSDISDKVTFGNSSLGNTPSDMFRFPNLFNDPFEVAMAMLQLLLCLTNFIGNTVTLTAISIDKTLQKNIQNKYIMSLASADQMTGMNMIQLLIKNYFMPTSDLWASCQINLVLLYMSTAVSLLNMLTIAVDRYFYIVHPFIHMRYVTSRRICGIIIIQWIIASIYGAIPIYIFDADKSKGCNPFYLLQRRFVAFSHPVFFFVDCIGIGITYGLIAKVAKEHATRKNNRVQQINATIANNAKLTKQKYIASNCNKFEVDTVPKFSNATKVYVKKTNILSVELISPLSDLNQVETDTIDIQSVMKNENIRINRETINYIKNNIPANKIISSIEGPYIITNELNKALPSFANDKDDDDRNEISLNKYTQSDVRDKENNETATMLRNNEDTFLEDTIMHADKNNLEINMQNSDILSHEICQINGQAHQEINISTTSQNINLEVVNTANQQQQNQVSPWNLSSLKWMKQMFLVFGLFFICWTPTMVCIFMSVSFEPSHRVVYILSMFGMSNSAVNFFVYSLYNKTFRSAICRMLSRCRTRNCNSA